ncbi:nitroreductase family deazaflavin-dependent oxidoreductase [Nonomuraea sp. NPDC048826]|uniref:nitroreductase family deazaflavin-dependent oxidoreductase n=1 Tax=Nonomuraea sp. NPDC048826 TaxID=3364347 RepID=UPI00371FCFED
MEILDTPPKPSGIRRLLFRLPIHLYRLRLGWLMGGRFMLVTHIGRVSGEPRQVVVETVDHDVAGEGHVAAAGYGRRSDWYRNVLKTPEVVVQVGSRARPMVARPLEPEEGAELMATYALRNPGLAKRLVKLMGFLVDGSESDYREVGRRIPFVRFTPR